MNLPDTAKYLRIHIQSFRRNLYGEYSDMPREKVKVSNKDKDGKVRNRWQFKFDLEKVLEYFEKKYNDIK